MSLASAVSGRRRVATRSPDPTTTLLLEIRAEQRRQAGILADILRALERGRGPRDQADAALLRAVAVAIDGRAFRTSGQLFAHAGADAALRDAFEAADITNTQELGCVLRRLEGIAVEGLRLERVRNSREGVQWCVVVCEA